MPGCGRGTTPDLHEAEAETEQGIGHPCAFVEPGGEADRIGESPSDHIDGEARIVSGRRGGGQGRKGADRQVVGTLGIEPVQQGPHQGKGRVDHCGRIPSGKLWRPSGPRGISSTDTTAESGKSP